MLERETGGIAYTAGRWPLDPSKPTLVFLHGAGGTSVLWQGQVDALADRANTLALDLPGRGRTGGTGRDRIEDYARDVASFLAILEAPGPIPCGLSMGGAIAQQLLLDHAETLLAGILVGTGARLRVMPVVLETVERRYSDYVGSFVSYATTPASDPECIRPLAEATAECDPRVALDDFRACDAFDVMERLSTIRLPVLVVSSEDDRLTPPKYGAYLEAHIPGAERVHITDAGHLVPMEKPETFNDAVRRFLDRLGTG